MKIKAFIMIVLLIIMGLPCLVVADMSSTSYSIPTSVMSSGGAPMGSAHFQSNQTIGQPSPPAITSSASYDLYAGFWHTLSISGCIWDLEPDGDVDGFDLYQFINPPYNASDIETFRSEFGRTDCF